ncbi:hypothetical protein ACFO4N_14435 [Camelliibacillus cellulosilyticus]|uniref:Uncharacterized protein n=1 Tax=Camelliibacillus cellulosilyticus TaxID=2174486 RepID=A0ABV9GPH1_9BACL
MKTIFWFALSNLIMVEILLNMHGLMNFIFQHGLKQPEIIVISLVMILIPLVILFFIADETIRRVTGRPGGDLR